DNKIEVKWVIPGEFEQGFEDGIPPTWKTNQTQNNPSAWIVSGFQPHSGTKSIKFDVYSPGVPTTDWLITEKIHISSEKPKFKVFLKTAFALGNSYSSFIKLSTVSQDPSTFNTTLKELSPVYLADSNLIWRPLEINLSNYINQDVYLAFECKAEDIIIYLDDMQMFGQQGLTTIGQNVLKYNLYRNNSDNNLQNSNNLIYSGNLTSFTDNNIIQLTNYYYGVSAVYNDNFETEITEPSFGIAYSQPDSLVIENASGIIPIIDGQIKEDEYTDAIKVILTKRGYFADAYLKIANNKLFIAVNAFSDSVLNENDYFLFAFDKNRNFKYEEGTEGYYRLRKSADGIEKAFFPFTVFGFDQGALNPDGFEGMISNNEGYNQFEMSLDITSSLVNINSSSLIGAYIGYYNADNNLESGWLERLLSAEYSVAGFGSITFNSIVKVENTNNKIPTSFVLYNNYPNPFNPSTIIKFAIPFESEVSLTIYNTIGQKVETIVNEILNTGNYEFNFNASNLSSGVYYYELKAKNKTTDFIKTNKMLLIK
ncbi:MAG TPA: choice-of-anchor J domain-containing protein, partial [Melioribacteraceae bacterium]|nr:choice-of-anchor J domain-containing protein [Melioribacteraceae bacterium]